MSYLALSCLYLTHYVARPNDISLRDVKSFCPGHWGCVPGIIFALENISEWSQRHDAEPEI
ncbi:MAG: hypothetical protein ACRDQW_06600, partial [Haloechinothrix sp.]